jgi:hypothetical protein
MLAFFDNASTASKAWARVIDKWIVEPELELATPVQAAQKGWRRRREVRRGSTRRRPLAPAQAAWEGRAAPAPVWSAWRPASARPAGGGAGRGGDGTVTVTNASGARHLHARRPLPAVPVTAPSHRALADPPRGSPGRADYGSFLVTRVVVGRHPRRQARP